jgi:hypothetical protein
MMAYLHHKMVQYALEINKNIISAHGAYSIFFLIEIAVERFINRVSGMSSHGKTIHR